MNEGRRRQTSLWATVGVVAALLSLLLLIPRGAAHPLDDDRPEGARAAVMFGAPLAGGMRATIEEAEQTFPATFLRPDAELASDHTLKTLWMRLEGDPELYVEYETGIVLIVRPRAGVPGTSEYAEAQIADAVPGSVIELGDGVAAFEVPQSDEGDLGSVRLAVGDAVVVVIGGGDFPPETLRDERSIRFGNDELQALIRVTQRNQRSGVQMIRMIMTRCADVDKR